MVHTRVCKHCLNVFHADTKYSGVCGKCKKFNHDVKVLRNLFLEKKE